MQERGVSLLGVALVAGVFVFAGLGVASCGTAFSSGAEGDAGTGPQDATADNVVVVVDGAADGMYETGADAEGGTDSSAMDVTIAEAGGPEAAAEGGEEASGEAAAEGGLDAGAEAGSEGGAEAGPEGGADAGTCSVSGQSCIPAAPPGWTGPVEFYYGTATPPGCPASTTTAFTAGTGLNAPPATCSACTCGAESGESCGATLSFYDSPSCTTPCASGALGTTCSPIGPGTCAADAGTYVTATATPVGGMCTPSTQVPTVPPTSWTSNAEVCASSSVPPSCGTAGVCLPGAASNLRYCVYQSGDVPCPSGSAYTTPQLVYGGVSDDRSCTACTCGAPGGQCSGGTYTEGKGCPLGANVPLPTPCTSTFMLLSAIPAAVVTPPTLQPGSCARNGGTPTGSATESSPITVCCGP